MTRKTSIIVAAIAALALTITGTASAHAPHYYIVDGHHGTLDCERSQHAPDEWNIGPFGSRDDCEALLTPTAGPVCRNGETQDVNYPRVVVYIGEGSVTFGPCPIIGTPTSVAPPHDSGAQLCYSVASTSTYTTYSGTQTKMLLDAGYWLPTATGGHVDPATGKLVGFTLVCGPQGKQGVAGNAPPADEYTDPNGDPLDPNAASSTGFEGVYRVA